MKKISVVAIASPEHEGLYLFGRRRDNRKITLPGGHANEGEAPEAAAKRELLEETGLEGENFRLLTDDQFETDHGQIHVHLYTCDIDQGKINTKDDPDSEFTEMMWADPLSERDDWHVPPHRNLLAIYLRNLNKADLEKMSRPKLRFPNFGTDPRAEQNVQLITNNRQKELYGRKIAAHAHPDQHNVPKTDVVRNPDGTLEVKDAGTISVDNQKRRDKTATYVSGVLGRRALGINSETRRAGSGEQKSFQSALAGKMRSKFEDADEDHIQAKKDVQAAKLATAQKYYDDLKAWRANSAGKSYEEMLATKPVRGKNPRMPSKKLKDDKQLTPEAQTARGRDTDTTIEHEAAHGIFDTISHKYGPAASQTAKKKLVESFDPETYKHVAAFTASRGYKPRDSHFSEEVLNAARDILTSPKRRAAFAAQLGDKAPEVIKKLKQSWQKAYETSQKLTPADVTSDDMAKKSELAKGQNGDWQKEGYKISHSDPDDQGVFEVYAHDKKGKIAGYAPIVPSGKKRISGSDEYTNEKYGLDGGTMVYNEHRRKGLASAMYSHAEKVSGKKMVPAKDQSDEAKKLWSQKKRPFGKSSLEKGANQRLFPYNPGQTPRKDRAKVEAWQEIDGQRDHIPELTGNARIRALRKLAAVTKWRRNPNNGEAEFLLHRGASPEENQSHHLTSMTSWTPHHDTANGFAHDYLREKGPETPVEERNIFSHWIPESAIHHIPLQVGPDLSPGASVNALGERISKDPEGKPKGVNPDKVRRGIGVPNYRNEFEVVVKPNYGGQKAGPQEVESAIGEYQSPDINERINARGADEKSRQSLKAPKKPGKLAASELQKEALVTDKQYRIHYKGQPITKPMSMKSLIAEHGPVQTIEKDKHSKVIAHEPKLEKSDSLQKGVKQRLFPVKAPKPEMKGQSKVLMLPPGRELEHNWQSNMGGTTGWRDALTQQTPEERARGLLTLQSRTKTRKNPNTGENEYLLHRGHSAKEIFGESHKDRTSSWAPDYETARHRTEYIDNDNDRKVTSAWFPESDIKHMVYQTPGAFQLESKYNKEGKRIGDAPHPEFNYEREVVISPNHRGQLATKEDVVGVNTTPLSSENDRYHLRDKMGGSKVNRMLLDNLKAKRGGKLAASQLEKSDQPNPLELKFQDPEQVNQTLQHGTFGLISPERTERTPEENQKAHRALIQDLQQLGHKYTPVGGQWGGSKEQSYMVHGISTKDLQRLGQKYGQMAVIHSDRGHHQEIPTHKDYTSKMNGTGHDSGEHLQDNYSHVDTLKGPHRFALKLGNGLGKSVKSPSKHLSQKFLQDTLNDNNISYSKNGKKQVEYHQDEMTDLLTRKKAENADKWADEQYKNMKKEELDKSKNVREQKKKVFGSSATPAVNSPMREKQMQHIARYAEDRYGLPVKRAPGKKNASGQIIDKPELGNEIQHIGNPSSMMHELAHIENADSNLSPEQFQDQMDDRWGALNQEIGYKQQSRAPEEYEAHGAETKMRRQLGLPINVRETKEKGDKRLYSAKVPDKQIAMDVPHNGRTRRITALSSNLDARRKLFEARQAGLEVHHPEMGWQESASPDALINRRDMGDPEGAKRLQREKFASRLRERLSAKRSKKV